MPARKILILGCGGSGKSTLARELSASTGFPIIHLDREHWAPGWTEVPDQLFRSRLEALLQEPAWICDGNYADTLELRLRHADRVIFLAFSRAVCLLGVLRRYLTYRGRSRPDMSPGCPERLPAEFLWWIWSFNDRVRPAMLETVQRSGLPCLVLRSRAQLARWLRETAERELSQCSPPPGGE